ncbi:MAG: pilin [Firmicutes bacterium]|nr:pilin [Bacillota bacterium]
MPDAAVVQIISRLTSILVDLAGGVFTLVMVYGGIRFMLSHNPRAVQSSKELMGRAAIGLGLVLMVDVLRQLIQYVVS